MINWIESNTSLRNARIDEVVKRDGFLQLWAVKDKKSKSGMTEWFTVFFIYKNKPWFICKELKVHGTGFNKAHHAAETALAGYVDFRIDVLN